jgi:hypothetical protein
MDYCPQLTLIRLQMRNAHICVANILPLKSHTILKAGLNSRTNKSLDLSQAY